MFIENKKNYCKRFQVVVPFYNMGKHEKFLQRMLHKPISANLSWSDIESLILSYGAKMKEGSGSRVSFTLNGVVASFHRPHGAEKTDKGAVNSVIQFLRNAEVIE